MIPESGDSSIAGPVTLVVFCRRPASGVGKRRIAASLGDRLTYELADRMLATTLEDAAAWPGPIVIAPASREDADWANGLLPDRAVVIPQSGGGLGERINAVDSAARKAGHTRLLFVGSDAPTLTPEDYERASAELDDRDVVLGIAADGGVTMMGSSGPWPDLSALPWSTEGLADALDRACRQQGLMVSNFDARYDVDRTMDLERLLRDLADDDRPARRALVSWLRETGLQRTPGRPTISLVVPVLDDADALRDLLGRLRNLPEQPFEIVIADASGRDGCRKICERYDCIRLRTKPGRGHQLHAGAMRASGDAIWFLHADTDPPEDAIARIRDHLAAGNIGGFFRFRFAGSRAWYKSLLAMLINLRCRFGIPYGDQGLFITRSAYLETGGFADAPLFEEVRFVRAARKAGRFSSVDASVGVSPRRWERDGWVKRTLHNRWLALGHMIGISPARLARSYRQRDDKRTARC